MNPTPERQLPLQRTFAPGNNDTALLWRRAFRDLPADHGFVPLRVEGTVPPDLQGTLYRNGPGQFSLFGRSYDHWFDGDGAISAVRFRGGAAEGAVRIVEGEALLEERRHRKMLYSGYGTPTRSRFRELVLGRRKNAANTSVVYWQNRLLALWEGGNPTEVDPETLRTLGETDLGVVHQTFSAHPHRARQSIFNFGIRFGRHYGIDLHELPAQGPARRMGTVPLPKATMIHDFIATEKHFVFFAPPLRLRVLRTLLRIGSFSENLEWRGHEGTLVVVVPIDDPTAVRTFETEGFFNWHFANAFEDGDEIVVDYIRYPDFSINRWLGRLPRGETPRFEPGTLHRARIAPAQNRFVSEERLGRPCEFPKVAPAVESLRHRYVYLCADEVGHTAPLRRIVRCDTRDGSCVDVVLGPEQYPSEPIYVPRSPREGDGYLLSLVYDGLYDRSHVAILDAGRLEDGPVARVAFEHHIPMTFHGVWAPAP